MLPQLPSSWGPSSRGTPIVINETPSKPFGSVIALDIETDELDNFVGGAIYDGTDKVYYFTDATIFKSHVAGKQIVGYNVKSDLNWIRLMGLAVPSANIHSDPMIMSYVKNSNREKQGLKDVAKEELGWSWPSYKDMVGKGKAKVTLDKHPIEEVAEYCGMDALATWRLYEKFSQTFSVSERNLYTNIEMPLYRLLWDMESRGINLDQKRMAKLKVKFDKELIDKQAILRAYAPFANFNSPKQVMEILHRENIRPEGTAKDDLEPYKENPLVKSLLKYRKIKKMVSTYIVPFENQAVINTTYNQVSMQSDGELHGIRTGRLSSSDPNLQNIPAKRKGETYGSDLRSLFVPSKGKVFIDADYSQIEYRLLAHYSQEPTLVNSFKNGADVHETTGKLLVPNNANYRSIGKTLNFASIYGARAKKVSNTAGVSEMEAEVFLETYWKKLPKVAQWISQTKMLAKARGGVCTMSGRYIPLVDLKSKNQWKRFHAERAAINYIIQGSAADIIKVAMLELTKKGYTIVLQVHDELIFEVDPQDVARAEAEIKQIMENVVTLSVPIVADIGHGCNWDEAKGE